MWIVHCSDASEAEDVAGQGDGVGGVKVFDCGAERSGELYLGRGVLASDAGPGDWYCCLVAKRGNCNEVAIPFAMGRVDGGLVSMESPVCTAVR